MKADKIKHDPGGKFKNGIFKENFKDGILSCEGEYIGGKNVGEWRAYDANGKVAKTNRHKLS